MKEVRLQASLLGQLLLLQLLFSSSEGVDHVHIGGFFPMSDVDGRRDQLGWGVMPSVKLALRHVNQDPHILPNTILHVTWNDTQCNAAVAIKAFYDLIHNSPSKLVLFGAACTHVTDPVAKASRYWNLAQVTYADTHPKFTARDFPNFFRVVPNARDLDIARIAFITKQGWKRVGTLCQDNPRYTLAHNDMVGLLHEEDVAVVAMQTFADKLTDQLQNLMKKDVRVVLGSFDETWARRIFCRAHRLGMYGRKYQWLLVGMYSENWWQKADDNHEAPDDPPCTARELEQSVQGVMLFDILHLSNNQRKTVSGLTALQYKKLYDASREDSYSRFHGYAYDGIWAIAYALHHVDWLVRHNRSPLPGRSKLTNFQYQDPRWETLIMSALKDTSFEGVTGPVKFRNNDRRGFVVINQIKGNLTSCVGVYDLIRLRWLTRTEDDRITSVWWSSGHAPVDQTITFIQKARVNLQIYVVLVVLASLGIVMAVVFLFVNVRYRNQRYIKMSSPYLNNLIIVGCMLTYTSVILLGLDTSLTSETSFPIVCAAKSWVLMAGFTLAFGSMFSKTWRVHSIFTDIKLNKKVIKDYQLYIVVGILLSIDIAIMTTWQIFDPFYRDTKLLKGYPHPTNDDAIVVPEIEYCKSDRMTVFVGCIYAYKGLLMIFGCFLAWETRHVNIAALNDSKYIGMSVYNVVIMCVIGVAISFVLADHQDAAFLMISVFILFCTTGTLCLVFVPKLIELRKSSDSQHQQKLRATLKPPSKKGFQYSCDSGSTGVRENVRRSEDLQARLRLRLNSLMHEYEELKNQVGEDADAYVQEKRPSASQLIVPRLSCLGTEVKTQSTEITSVYSYPEGLTSQELAQNRKRSSVLPSQLPAISASVSSLRESSSAADPGVAHGMEVTLSLTATDSAHRHGVVVLESLTGNQCSVNGGISTMSHQYKQWTNPASTLFRKFSGSSSERRSLECPPAGGHLTVPSCTQPRRCSDPGPTKYSLANAIHEVNLSLSNIIKATSLSTASFTTEVSCSAEFAPFQLLDSSKSINIADGESVKVTNNSIECVDVLPKEMGRDHQPISESNPNKIALLEVYQQSTNLKQCRDCPISCTITENDAVCSAVSSNISSSCSTISRGSGAHPSTQSLPSASSTLPSDNPGSTTTCSWPQSAYSCHSSTDSLDSLSAECGDSVSQPISDSVQSAVEPADALDQYMLPVQIKPKKRARAVQTLISGSTLQRLEIVRDSKLQVVNIDPSELMPIAAADLTKSEAISGAASGTSLQSGSRHSSSCPRLLGGTLTPFFQSDPIGTEPASDIDMEQQQIVPIFHRLAQCRQLQMDSQGRRTSRSLATSSCPNISIKCDIVEYL